MLVFCSEPWKLLGTNVSLLHRPFLQAIAINEKIQYALVKCTYKSDKGEAAETEYLILAEKRIAEFSARAAYTLQNGEKQQCDLKPLVLI